VVVITGAGRAFCAGGDVGRMSQVNSTPPPIEERIDRLRGVQELSWLLYNMPKPTIAAVNGFALGAGFAISMSCDFRIASEQAKFGSAYAKLALSGDYGLTWLLARYLGPSKAKELLFFAEMFDAAEALRLGLVSKVVPHDSLGAEANAYAGRLAKGPLIAYRYQKENVNLSFSRDFLAMLDREAETTARCSRTEDHREGVRAFVEKRPAKFSGQ